MNTYPALRANLLLALSLSSLATLAGVAGCSEDVSPPVGADASTAKPSDASVEVDARAGDAGTVADSGGGENARCVVASDCRLYSSSCGTCACIPLNKGQIDPVCNDTPTSCLVDPCQNKTADCVGGVCIVK